MRSWGNLAAEAAFPLRALRGAEVPLFHGIARMCAAVKINVKINVKGIGQECPIHTGWYHPRDGAAREVYYF
jgi:hypothetical protein